MWLLQKNIWKEEKYNHFISFLDRYEIPNKVVEFIPFSNNIDLPCEAKDVSMVFGSIKFTEVAAKQGIKVHFNENFNYKVWSKIFKDKCLNRDSKITTISKLKTQLPLNKDIFIRPILDDKSFTGGVLFLGQTINNIQFTTSKPIDDIVIQVASVKKIYTESRYFVVNGKIITGSYYRDMDRVSYQNLDVQEHIAKSEWQFAQKMVNKWQPSDMFCIDIAGTPEGYKIIEFGSIHNCGFYDINISKLIQIIEYATTN